MPDYYALLEQKIREAEGDAAILRELVYANARLALKRHVNVHYPALSLRDGKRLISDLEQAIERLEADKAGPGVRPAAPGVDAAASIISQSASDRPAVAASQEFNFPAAYEGKSDDADRADDRTSAEARLAQAPHATYRHPVSGPGNETPLAGEPEDEHAGLPPRRDHDAHRAPRPRSNNRFAGRGSDERRSTAPPRTRLRGSIGSGEGRDSDRPYPIPDADRSTDWAPHADDDRAGSRDLVLVPEHSNRPSRNSTYVVSPQQYSPRQDEIYRDPPAQSKKARRTILIGVAVVSQAAIVVLAGAAFYVSFWGRNSQSPAQEIAATARRSGAGGPILVGAGKFSNATSEASPASSEPTLTAAQASAAIPPLAMAATPAVAAVPAFPRPTAYGVYAISDNQLIELEQIPTAPVDPRAKSTLQIVKPSRTVIPDGKLAFLAYRRDLITSAPDKVPVRVAARIARAMTFDGAGKAVTAPPQVDTWLIREQGYDLRVSPVRDNPEMVTMRPADDDFSFPPGRYEILLGAQSYDFVIAGNIEDPAQCVEGVATARGPAFYECRTQ